MKWAELLKQCQHCFHFGATYAISCEIHSTKSLQPQRQKQH